MWKEAGKRRGTERKDGVERETGEFSGVRMSRKSRMEKGREGERNEGITNRRKTKWNAGRKNEGKEEERGRYGEGGGYKREKKQ